MCTKVLSLHRYIINSNIICASLHRDLKVCRTFSSSVEPVSDAYRSKASNILSECNENREQVLKNSDSHGGSARSYDSDITDTSLEIRGSVSDSSSITGPCNEDLSSIAPYTRPAFNFAAYVNKSRTLQELVKLGVNLSKLEYKRGVPEVILQLDFDKDIREYIRFLHDKGVPSNELGTFLTKNPRILKQNLDDLLIRINYLQSKKFTDEMITRIITKNPFWLMFSTADIDWRLGYFQTTFELSGNEVRSLAAKQPRLITYSLAHIKKNTFSLKEEMGFSADEMKSLLMKSPRIWMKSNKVFLQAFHYVHNVMKLPHQQILDFPEILKSRIHRTKQRHLFLQSLGRAQYNPNLEGYVSPGSLVIHTDTEFCQTVARSSVEAFNIFLKSL